MMTKKKSLLCRIVLLASVSIVFATTLQASEKEEKGRTASRNVLMLGLTDNVKSDYFPRTMIAEETGMMSDEIDKIYNAIIMENIKASARNSEQFISINNEMPIQTWHNLIQVTGEAENSNSDVSQIPISAYQEALDMANAEYLLVINQHFLKWQERPMRTLFHIVSYTLFDKEQNEVYQGNHYFTSMNLESPDRLRRTSNRTSSRIAATISNQINKIR